MDELKRQAAARALEAVRDGMKLGLGTGSTAKHFVELLGEKVRAGMKVVGVPTSEATSAISRLRNVGASKGCQRLGRLLAPVAVILNGLLFREESIWNDLQNDDQSRRFCDCATGKCHPRYIAITRSQKQSSAPTVNTTKAG